MPPSDRTPSGSPVPQLVPTPKAAAWVNHWLDQYVSAANGPAALEVVKAMGVAFDLETMRAQGHGETLGNVEKVAHEFTIGHLSELVDETRHIAAVAVAWGEEGWAYASDYFKEKWSSDKKRLALRAAIGATPDEDLPTELPDHD